MWGQSFGITAWQYSNDPDWQFNCNFTSFWMGLETASFFPRIQSIKSDLGLNLDLTVQAL